MKNTDESRTDRSTENKIAENTQAESRETDSMDAENLCGEVRVSVRGLVEFVLRHGDIDDRRQGAPENAMQEGGRIHRMIQRRMGADYQAEVSLKYTQPAAGYLLAVEGRADGIFPMDGEMAIDEIKGTYRELSRLKEPLLLHLAQAKCYAYIYSLQQKLSKIHVRLTYCHIPTEDVRYFYQEYTFQELEQWFGDLIASYRRWADYSWEWRKLRNDSIQGLAFPFDYREGQRELAANVYRTIYHGRKLFLEAPTGVGKTISTIYPSIQAMGKGMAEKLFYLTAKTITGTVAENTIGILRRNGLRFKSVILTAREKICFLEEPQCSPDCCPYARGHFDRVNDAMYDLLTGQESFTREQIEKYAQKHQVCPFELCLDMSLFADGVICDYNYLFDPHVYLKRFFGEGAAGSYVFLVDEAHNLLERGREMYSASLRKSQFLEMRRELKETILSETAEKARKSDVSGQMTLEMTLITPETSQKERKGQRSAGRGGGKSILIWQGYADRMIGQAEKCSRQLQAIRREYGETSVVEGIDGFVQALIKLHGALDEYLDQQEEGQLPIRDRLLDFFFEVSHFLEIYELADDNYVKYVQTEEDGDFLLKLFCVDPGDNLKNCMARGRSTILFSATFLPIQYYKKLLGGAAEDYEVYARSVFDPERQGLYVACDVTSRYIRRSEEEYYNIARYIEEIVKNRHGNYMVFCPSYAFLRILYEKYREYFSEEGRECILQSESMSESEREDFLARFRGGTVSQADLQAEIAMEIEEEDSILIGFCVLGGIFGEGIDLKNDGLIGAIIVGTGIPQVCFERELLKNYFDRKGESGFDYAYRYPGMNKVLQAAGRVIRTAEDIGIVALLDERFLQPAYQRLYPRGWENYEAVSVDTVSKRVERFWDSWL